MIALQVRQSVETQSLLCYRAGKSKATYYIVSLKNSYRNDYKQEDYYSFADNMKLALATIWVSMNKFDDRKFKMSTIILFQK